MLCFHSKTATIDIRFTSYHNISALHKVTAVKLQAWLCGKYLHFYSAFIAYNGCNRCVHVMLVQYEVMVIPLAILNLFVVGFDPGAYGSRFCEIKRSTGNRRYFTCWYRCRVNWCIVSC